MCPTAARENKRDISEGRVAGVVDLESLLICVVFLSGVVKIFLNVGRTSVCLNGCILRYVNSI